MAKIKLKSRFCDSNLVLFQSKFLIPMNLFVCLSISESAHTGTFNHVAHIYCGRLVWGLHLVLFSVPPALVRLHWEWPPAWFGWLNWRSWIWCKQRLENSPVCVHFSLTPATAVRCQASLSGRDGTHTENKAHLSLASSQGTPRQPQMCEKARISRTAGLETVSDCCTTPLKSGAAS